MSKTAIAAFLVLFLPFQFALNPLPGIDLAIFRIITPIVFLGFLAESLARKKLVFPNHFSFWGALLFPISAVIGLSMATESAWGIRKIVFFASLFPLYIVFASWATQKFLDIRRVFSALSLSGSLVAFVALLQFSLPFFFGLNAALEAWRGFAPFFLGKTFFQAVSGYSSWLVNIGGETIFRAIGLFPDPHMLAFFLELLLFIPLFTYLETRRKIFLFQFVLIFAALLGTFSRGAYVGIGTSLILCVLFLLGRREVRSVKRTSSKTLIFVFCLLATSGIVLFGRPVVERLFTSVDISEGSNAGRFLMWQQGVYAFSSRPIFGIGLGNFPRFVEPSADYRSPIYAHNTYLDIAAEMGIFGVVFWIMWTVGSIASSFIKAKQCFPLFGVAFSLIAFSTHAFFDTPIFSIHVFSLLCVVTSLHFCLCSHTRCSNVNGKR